MEQSGVKFKKLGIYLIWLTMGFGTIYSIRLGSKQYDMALVEVFLTLIFLVLLLTSSIKIPPKEPLILLSLLFIWTLFGVLGARNQMQSLSLVLSVLYSIITYIISYDYFQNNPEVYFSGLRLFSLIVAIQIIWVAVSVVASGTQEVTYDGFKSVIKIPLGASNFLAIFLEYALLIEISVRRRFWGLCSTITFIALTLTFSKAGFLALSVGFVLWLILSFFRQNDKLTLLWLLIPLGMVFLFLKFSKYGQVYWKAITGITQAHSVYSRLELWQQSLQKFVSAPIMGTGLSWSDETHNIFLQLLSNTGIIGFIIFFLLVVSIYLKLVPTTIAVLRSQDKLCDVDTNAKIAFFIAFCIILLHSTVEPFFFNATTQIWFGFFLAGINVTNYSTIN